MDSIRLQNYRCFDDTGYIDIKPLTFLIGANGSGKSSFLKLLPLLKQSMNVKVNGVFLWADEDVDFNNFKNTLKEGSDEMTVTMTISDLRLARRSNAFNCFFPEMDVTMKLRPLGDNFDFLSSLEINYADTTIVIVYDDTFNVNYIRVNGFVLNSKELKMKNSITNSLLPKLLFYDKDSRYFDEQCDLLLDKICNRLNIHPEDVAKRRQLLLLGFRKITDRRDLVDYLHRKNQSDSDELQSHIDEVSDMYVMYHINNIIDSLNMYFLSSAANINYVQPVRVFTKRYYRFQNFAVDDIDPDGRNLAMFFNSLSSEAMDNLNSWLGDIFGFQLAIKINDGSLEIVVIEPGKSGRNMVDVGFGYTQCLPILTLIWKVAMIDCINNHKAGQDRFCDEHIIAIEQPELHLHPRFQALFAEMLVRAIRVCRKDGKKIKFVIETHSPTIINMIGELIATKILSSQDVNVVLFNASHEGLHNYVEQTGFTEDGFIHNWPYGFFSHVDRS